MIYKKNEIPIFQETKPMFKGLSLEENIFGNQLLAMGLRDQQSQGKLQPAKHFSIMNSRPCNTWLGGSARGTLC